MTKPGYAVLLLFTLLVSACVTETKGSLAQKYDADRSFNVALQAGATYLEAGDLQNANRHLTNALKLKPDSPEANNAMAMLYRADGNRKKQQEYLRKALRNDGNFSPALNNYGVLLYNEGKYEEALEQFEKASRDIGYNLRWNALFNMAECYTKLGEDAKAEQAYFRAIREAPGKNLPQAYLALGELYLRKGKTAKAAEFLQQYEVFAKPSAQSLWLGVRLQRILGNQDKLASYVLALRRMYPESPERRAYEESLKQ